MKTRREREGGCSAVHYGRSWGQLKPSPLLGLAVLLSSLSASTIYFLVRMQFSPLKSSAAISPDLFFRHKSMLAGLESLPEAYQQRIVSMMEQVSWVNSSIRMALHGCYCHHIKLTNHRRTPNSFSFSSYISNPKFPKNKRGQRDSSENDAYPRFLVVMRQTELPASN
ncbi:hypothetical protein HN51_069933 [Arachis hypogaea]